ncbi:MAG: exodeoxyribonuclease VII large subunit [Planctomycetota bacterium]
MPQDDAPTWTIPQVAARLRSALSTAFPEPFWLVGEVNGLARSRHSSSGHWYFQLVDDQAPDPARRASLSVILWRQAAQRLFGPRGRLPQPPEDGLVLRVRVKPDWYEPSGRLSFVIDDVDPEFTLGTLDRQRRELLARLTEDGSLQRNRSLPCPPVPLRLGLITAHESAAYNDVLSGLQSAAVGFQVLCCDARMQGVESGPSICAALATLAARRVEVILLVRGGGSRLDLSWFDREDIARAIAACPVPVFTGIGHEIDSSVADAVAQRSFKTPTAVAEFLVEQARTARRESEERFEQLTMLAREALAEHEEQLIDAAQGLRVAAVQRVTESSAGLLQLSARLRAGTERGLRGEEDVLAERLSRLRRGRHLQRLALLASGLERDVGRLGAAARSRCEALAAALEASAARARLLDPRQVLARGFAWLRRPDGSLLKDAARAVPRESLVVELRDGSLDVQVLAAGLLNSRHG